MDTRDPFDDLLDWLDPAREVAGQKYRIIHAGLVRMFAARGFSDAEDLADETVKRVTDLLPKVKDSYVGEPARYFYRVARYVMLEAFRRPEIATNEFPVDPPQGNNTNDTLERLLECLDLLTEEQRELILEYHMYKGREKIEHHKRMAEERGISVGALRSRAHNIREALEKCVTSRRGNKRGRDNHPLRDV
ncbi:MAG: sigma-70 family RNA polymerase sigma factor [Acidobacteria bacterium]|nr:sigma-70 family RNA polymerase sigma factor [Acidobacteriota bacterium]